MRRATSPRTFGTICSELDRRRRVALGFERIDALLDALGHPERDIPHIVQVVGTNGKGSTAVSVAAALEEKGHPTGVYLSPHVLSYTERVMVEGRTVSEAAFAEAMGEVIDLADERNVPATQFELLTAGALKMFRDLGLPWAVLEAGLGARHDATTAAGPEAVVLTNVALDHTEYLGETIEAIAREKLASLRRGMTVIMPARDERLVRVATRESARVGARFVQVGETDDGEASVPGVAPFLARNVAFGFRAAEVLVGRALDPEGRTRAANRVVGILPARFEEHVVSGVPVLLDGGHNPEALRELLSAVRVRYGARPLTVVFGVVKGKDAGNMLSLLGEAADALVLTRPADAGGRAADPNILDEDHLPLDTRGRRASIMEDVGDALALALERSRGTDGTVLVTGSFHTAAGALAGLRRGGFG